MTLSENGPNILILVVGIFCVLVPLYLAFNSVISWLVPLLSAASLGILLYFLISIGHGDSER